MPLLPHRRAFECHRRVGRELQAVVDAYYGRLSAQPAFMKHGRNGID